MIGLVKALGVVKLAAAVAVLTTVSAFAATQVSLPAASDNGQAHASAAAANGQAHASAAASNSPSTNAPSGKDVSAITQRLAANKARLLENLNDVLNRLKANGANQHAIDAIQKVIDRITNGDTGLNRAMDVVANGGSAPAHPTASDHP